MIQMVEPRWQLFLHNLSYCLHKAFAETGCLLHHRSLGGAVFRGLQTPAERPARRTTSDVFRGMAILIGCPSTAHPNIWPTNSHGSWVEWCNSPLLETHQISNLVFSQIWRLSSTLQQVQSDLDLEQDEKTPWYSAIIIIIFCQYYLIDQCAYQTQDWNPENPFDWFHLKNMPHAVDW